MSDRSGGVATRVDHGLTLATGGGTAPARGQLQGERRTRRARLRISRIDPWSVMKTAFLFSIAFGIMTWIAVYVIWIVIGASGLMDAINGMITNLLASPSDQEPVRLDKLVDTNRVMGVTALIAVINVIILTALATIFAFLYNLSANIIGGLELTLAED